MISRVTVRSTKNLRFLYDKWLGKKKKKKDTPQVVGHRCRWEVGTVGYVVYGSSIYICTRRRSVVQTEYDSERKSVYKCCD